MKCFIVKCDTASSNRRCEKKPNSPKKDEKMPKSPKKGDKTPKSPKRGEKVLNSPISQSSLIPMRYQKRSMFKPQSAKMLKAWQRVIPDQNKELTMAHVLCELHFKKEDIDRERIVYKKGGIVEREVRKHPILNDEAVPCYFSENLRPRKAKEEYAVKLVLPANVSALLRKECTALIEKKRLNELEKKSFYVR